MTADYTLETHLMKLGELTSRLKRYRDEVSREQFMSDDTVQAAILRHLHLAAEAAMTIGEMLIADYDFAKPLRPKELFDALAKGGVLAPHFGDQLGGIVNFRNILVRDYLKIDLEKVYAVLQNDLEELQTYRETIARYVTDHPVE